MPVFENVTVPVGMLGEPTVLTSVTVNVHVHGVPWVSIAGEQLSTRETPRSVSPTSEPAPLAIVNGKKSPVMPDGCPWPLSVARP